MDGSQLLRAARRRAGLSQRELAARTGLSHTTIAAVEAGRRSPSWAVLTAVCATAELELTVDLPASDPTPADVAHLRLGLGERLRRALGVGTPPAGAPQPAVWSQLRVLAGGGLVVLHSDVAVGMWLPLPRPLERIEVCFTSHRSAAPAPQTPEVGMRLACGAHARVPVAVPVESCLVAVDSPGDLALDPTLDGRRASLRAVARLLHECAPRDAGGRHVRAHADPDHRGERLRISDTKRYGRLPIPPTTDTRSWRLDDSPGLRAWLRRFGYPD